MREPSCLGSGTGPLLQRFDAAGNPLWPGALPGGLDPYARSLRVVVDAAGNIYVAGLRTHPLFPSEALLLKLDAAGAVQWTRVWSGVAAGTPLFGTRMHRLVLDARGHPIVSGVTGTSTHNVAWTAAHDRNGNLLWSDAYQSVAYSEPGGLGVDSRADMSTTAATRLWPSEPAGRVSCASSRPPVARCGRSNRRPRSRT